MSGFSTNITNKHYLLSLINAANVIAIFKLVNLINFYFRLVKLLFSISN